MRRKQIFAIALASILLFSNAGSVAQAKDAKDLIFDAQDLIVDEENIETYAAEYENDAESSEDVISEESIGGDEDSGSIDEMPFDDDADSSPEEENEDLPETDERGNSEEVAEDAGEYPTGYVPEQNPIPIIHNEPKDSLLHGEDDLPTSYRTELLPPLHDQSPYATCWAFATTGLAEINLMKQGIMTAPDLSELHLAYFAYNTETDPLGGTACDHSRVKDNSGVLDLGGSYELALSVLASWMGAADENTAKYSRDAILANRRGMQSDLAYEAVAHVRNYYVEDVNLFNFRERHDYSMLAPIKRMVKEYGAAGLSFRTLSGVSPTTDSNIYNAKNNCYYNNFNAWSGHAVVIVGWDDNFPRENFSTTPPGDGAFLVRNSWMDEGDGNRDSFAGYCWMSYYEYTLDYRFYAVEMDPADNYENNYQYDVYTNYTYGGYKSGANVFTAHATGAVNGEDLRAVSFYSSATNADYTVEIYTDCEDTPSSGNLYEEATTTGVTDFAGYYTVELPDPVHIAAGSKFAVVVSFDCNALIKEGAFEKGPHKEGSEPGQSYEYRNGTWSDTGTSGNFKIKAFTDNAAPEEYIAPTDISFTNLDGNSISIGVGETFKVNADVIPESASHRKITWSSSNESVAKVVNGQIEGIGEGKATITAAVADGLVEKRIDVTINKKLLALTLSCSQVIEFPSGDNYFKYTPRYVPRDYEPEGEVVWNVDEDVISLDENGRITEHMMGETKVTATVDGVSASTKYTVEPSSKFFGYDVADDKTVTLKWKAAKNAVSYSIRRSGKTVVIDDDGSSTYEYVDKYYVGTDTESTTYYFAPNYGNGVTLYPFIIGLGKNYSITYHLNDGEQNPDNPTKYTGGNKYKLYDPTPPFGYEFSGWYTTPDFSSGSYIYEISRSTKGDLVLYAKYSPMRPTITVSQDHVTLSKGQSVQITAAYAPTRDVETYSFRSNDETIATVRSEGNTATITAGQREGATEIEVRCRNLVTFVYVKVAQMIWLDETDIELRAEEGAVKELKAHVVDEYASDPIDWTSSDESVATVRGGRVIPAADITEKKNIVITALVRGTDYSASCNLTVFPQAVLSAPKGYIDDEVTEYDGREVSKGALLYLKCENYGASIFYALDGNEPSLDESGNPADANTFRYEEALHIDRDTEVRAISYKKGCKPGGMATFAVVIHKNHWGDIRNEDVKSGIFDNDSANVPKGVWYLLGNPDRGYGNCYYRASSVIDHDEVYTGVKITFNSDINMFHGTRRLIEGRDYTVSYKNNLKPAPGTGNNAPTVIIKGKGSYTGSAGFTFTIRKAKIGDAELESESEVSVMVGSKVKLSATRPVLKFAGKTLKSGKDYVLKYYAEDGRIIEDPSKEILSEGGKSYTIEISAAENSFFADDVDGEGAAVIHRTVTVKTADPKTCINVSGLKTVNAGGKPVKIAYREQGYSIDELFDNREPSDGNGGPEIFVKSGKTVLVYGEDYVVEPADDADSEDSEEIRYTSAGTHKFVIRGIDKDDSDAVSYVGCKTGSFEITGIPMSKVRIAGLGTSVEYTGATIWWDDLFNAADKNLESDWNDVTLYYMDAARKKVPLNGPNDPSPDYDVSFEGVRYPGKYNIVFKGRNGYTGTIKKTITVKAYNVKNNSNGRLTVEVSDAEFSKAGAKPEVKVGFVTGENTDGEHTLLKEGIDYTLSYKNNVKAFSNRDEYLKLKPSARPTVIVKGIGNYTGSCAVSFMIGKSDISTAELVASDINYNAKGKKGYFFSAVKIYQGGKALSAGKGKDIDSFDKNALEYTYGRDTELGDKTTRYEGAEVRANDLILPDTLIKVTLKTDSISVGAKSSFTNDSSEGTDSEIFGYYRIVDPACNISKFKAEVRDKEKLSFDNADAVYLRESDVRIMDKAGTVLDTSDYEIASVTGCRFPGKTVIVIRGRGMYCGTKTITARFLAKKVVTDP